MLKAVREEDGTVGETASKFLAMALVEARQCHDVIEDTEPEEHDEVGSECDGTTIVGGSGSSVHDDRRISVIAVEDDMEEASTCPPEITFAEDDVENAESSGNQRKPFGARLIDFIVLLTRTLLSSPFISLLYSTQIHFLNHLHSLATHYSLTNMVLGMTRAVGYIAGWCDKRLGLGQMLGELGAVGVVSVLRVADAVLHEVVVHIKQIEFEEQQQQQQQRLEHPEQRHLQN